MDRNVEAAVSAVAARAGVPFANLMAVVEVESAGQVFAMVDGRQEPLIRYEGHYFFKALSGAKRDAAVRGGLASPKAGAIANPGSQQKRWDRLLKPAMLIDADAALESCSWGVGQVMGFHAKKLGYASVQEMVTATRSGIEGQIDAMIRYCRTFGLLDELERGDFAGFARGYNGPNFRRYSYDTKMAAAAKRYAALQPAAERPSAPTREDTSMLSLGSQGARVREAQALLVRAGHPVNLDGDFGPSTKQAVMAFQRKNPPLDVDGKIGRETWRELAAYRQDSEERPGAVTSVETPLATSEGRQGAGLGLIGTGAGAAGNQVQGIADQISYSGVSGPLVSYASMALYTIAGVLIVAGLAWAAWGYLKANRT